MKHCYIDVETTGLIPGIHSVIQLGAIIDGKEHSFNMQPFDGAKIEASALAVNGITPDILSTYPTYRESVSKFQRLLDNTVSKFDKQDKMIFLAYNAPFDEGFIRKIIGKYYGSYFWWPAVDVAVVAMLHLKEHRHKMPDFKLATVYETIMGKPLEEAHDAMADIRATKEIYEFCTGGE
jgi:DNA polymerase III alpha subunit (gram-positive type)